MNQTPNNSIGHIINQGGIIPYKAFNTTYNQGLNPGDYYGLQNSSCNQQGCVPNVVNQDRYNIPSVEEIAAYNNTQVSRTPQISAADTTQNTNPMQQDLNSNLSQDQNNLQSTPATTFDKGATISDTVMTNPMDGITDIKNPYPVTPENLQYLNGFLRTQIGRRVTIDFLVGSNTIISKSGFLLGVASNYILINELDTNDITTCDFYNIKFIRFYY